MKTAREVAHEFGRLALAPMDINCSAETHDPDCDAVTDLIEQARAEGAAAAEETSFENGYRFAYQETTGIAAAVLDARTSDAFRRYRDATDKPETP
jgi:hypothetical protein